MLNAPSPLSYYLYSALWHVQQPDLAVTIEEGGLRKWAITDQGVQVCRAATNNQLPSVLAMLHPYIASICCGDVCNTGLCLLATRLLGKPAKYLPNYHTFFSHRLAQHLGKLASAHLLLAYPPCPSF